MLQDRFRRVEDLFHRAVDLNRAERARLLDGACADDPSMRDEVEALLDADRGEDAIERVIDEAVRLGAETESAAAAPVPVPVHEGETLGPYVIGSKIGQGGMGAVYLAERADDAYRSTVAVKVLNQLSTPDAVERFRRERQILADLTHPNIARLLDGGTTSAGLPFVVMEHIEGEPIDVYCDRRRSTVRERVALFRKVAQAVEFAHSRLIVHRDIKPSNILVTKDGEPKLLDFGIAKSIASSYPDSTAALAANVTTTASVVRLMTPAFASPEQIKGEAITVATDIYGLGAVLYVLLTGRALHRFRNTTPAELERVVCAETHVPLPRAVMLDAADGSVEEHEALVSQRGAGTAKELSRALAGDLENIVGTALRKEAPRRYPSVERFSDDLLRYLDGRPVTARADDWSYRARKLAGRHRLAVASAAVFFASLIAFGSVILVQNVRIAEQRDIAEDRRVAAEEVTSFLVDTFRLSDPNESRGDVVTVRDALDRGTERLESLGDQPAIRASLEAAMGAVYKNLGLYEQARPLLESALATRRDLYGDAHPDVAAASALLADYAFQAGDYDRALALYREALETLRELGQMETDEAALSLDGLATALDATGLYDEAEGVYREALALTRRLHGDESVRVASALQNLSATLRTKGAFEEAEALNRRSLAIRRRKLGSDHLDTAHSLNQLARVLTLQGDPAGALPLAKEGLAIRRKAHGGRPHAEVAASLGNVAGILASLGRDSEALDYRRDSLENVEALFGREHPYVAATLSSLGRAQWAAGLREEAEVSLRRSVALHRTLFPEGNPDTASPLSSLGELVMTLGRLEEAEALLREALALRAAHLPGDHWLVATSRGVLGECLAKRGASDEASALLTASAEGLEAAFGSDDPRAREARERQARFLVEEASPE